MKVKKQDYDEKSITTWIKSIEKLKNKNVSMKKYSGKHSLNAFVIMVPLSKKIRINIGQKLLDKFNEKEKIMIIAHEIGHQLKHHLMLRFVAFIFLVALITILFSYIRDYTLLNFNFTLELRIVFFFLFYFLFFLLIIITYNGISFII